MAGQTVFRRKVEAQVPAAALRLQAGVQPPAAAAMSAGRKRAMAAPYRRVSRSTEAGPSNCSLYLPDFSRVIVCIKRANLAYRKIVLRSCVAHTVMFTGVEQGGLRLGHVVAGQKRRPVGKTGRLCQAVELDDVGKQLRLNVRPGTLEFRTPAPS